MNYLYIDPICDAFQDYAKRHGKEACDLPGTMTLGEATQDLPRLPVGVQDLDLQITVDQAVDRLLAD